MRIKFWGTRGSIPASMDAAGFRSKAKRLLMNAGGIDLSDESAVDSYLDNAPFPDAITFGGQTPCVEVIEGDHRLILDCGSGMRQLGRHIMDEGITEGQRIDIFQSHTHWDHIMGFPFFVPAYSPNSDIHIYGVHPKLQERFEQQMDLIHFPIKMDVMASKKTFHQLTHGEEVTVGPFTINNKGLEHPGGSYSYRISAGGKTVVYATDGEYKEPTDDVYLPYINYFKEADLLIFDAMYATLEKTVELENFGHSTALIGMGISLAAGVKKLLLFHHDPECDDDQVAESFFDVQEYLEMSGRRISENKLEIISAYDGLVLEI